MSYHFVVMERYPFEHNGNRAPLRWVLLAVGLLCSIILSWITAWYLIRPLAGDDPRSAIAAVQATFTVAFGVGGLGTLALFMHRQWMQLQTLRLNERIARDDRHDAEERRITELYMKAAELLGHEKGSVRLAALYALDRLGRNHEGHRQEIADVYYAHLRRPCELPASLMPRRDEAGMESGDRYLRAYRSDSVTATADEHQVRLTAQRLLLGHLRPSYFAFGDNYWSLDRIDLEGATLVNADFRRCALPSVNFNEAHFHGYTGFYNTTFRDRAMFHRSWFHGPTTFGHAVFEAWVGFEGARFASPIEFESVTLPANEPQDDVLRRLVAGEQVPR